MSGTVAGTGGEFLEARSVRKALWDGRAPRGKGRQERAGSGKALKLGKFGSLNETP